MINVGITGSSEWTELSKIKDFIFHLKTKYKDDVTIITCGERSGVDFEVKKICNNFEMNYKETRNKHYEWNSYCMEGPYYYGKPKYKNNVFIRNDKFVSYCDIIVLFIDRNVGSPVVINSIINTANKKNKNILTYFAK